MTSTTESVRPPHLLGWVSTKTQFEVGMCLETPAGSYYEVMSVRKVKVSVVMSSDEDSFAYEKWMGKKKRDTGRTEIWEITVRDMAALPVQSDDDKEFNRPGKIPEYERWMAIDPRTGGGRAWELNNHAIVTPEFAREQAERIKAERASITTTWTPDLSNYIPIPSSWTSVPIPLDERGLDEASEELRLMARVWLMNHYLGDPTDESQVNTLLVEMLRAGFNEVTRPIIRVAMRRFHSFCERKGNLSFYLEKRWTRDKELELRREESKRARRKTGVFDEWETPIDVI